MAKGGNKGRGAHNRRNKHDGATVSQDKGIQISNFTSEQILADPVAWVLRFVKERLTLTKNGTAILAAALAVIAACTSFARLGDVISYSKDARGIVDLWNVFAYEVWASPLRSINIPIGKVETTMLTQAVVFLAPSLWIKASQSEDPQSSLRWSSIIPFAVLYGSFKIDYLKNLYGEGIANPIIFFIASILTLWSVVVGVRLELSNEIYSSRLRIGMWFLVLLIVLAHGGWWLEHLQQQALEKSRWK